MRSSGAKTGSNSRCAESGRHPGRRPAELPRLRLHLPCDLADYLKTSVCAEPDLVIEDEVFRSVGDVRADSHRRPSKEVLHLLAYFTRNCRVMLEPVFEMESGNKERVIVVGNVLIGSLGFV